MDTGRACGAECDYQKPVLSRAPITSVHHPIHRFINVTLPHRTKPQRLQSFTSNSQMWEFSRQWTERGKCREHRQGHWKCGYSAINKFSANGHCSSIHCASQRKPAVRAIAKISSDEYL